MADEGGNRDANIKETVRFWRAWKTVHQLCKDRVCDENIVFVSNQPAYARAGVRDDTMLIATACRDTSSLTRR